MFGKEESGVWELIARGCWNLPIHGYDVVAIVTILGASSAATNELRDDGVTFADRCSSVFLDRSVLG